MDVRFPTRRLILDLRACGYTGSERTERFSPGTILGLHMGDGAVEAFSSRVLVGLGPRALIFGGGMKAIELSDGALRGMERSADPAKRALAKAVRVQRNELRAIQREAKRLRKSGATDEELRHGLRGIQAWAKAAARGEFGEARGPHKA